MADDVHALDVLGGRLWHVGLEHVGLAQRRRRDLDDARVGALVEQRQRRLERVVDGLAVAAKRHVPIVRGGDGLLVRDARLVGGRAVARRRLRLQPGGEGHEVAVEVVGEDDRVERAPLCLEALGILLGLRHALLAHERRDRLDAHARVRGGGRERGGEGIVADDEEAAAAEALEVVRRQLGRLRRLAERRVDEVVLAQVVKLLAVREDEVRPQVGHAHLREDAAVGEGGRVVG
mmetsp:Transcript_14182/g.37465  ORF Transcript_14182/g.37465 Transcript_14182/m.37465 type:complete len:234 (-) Transcript_14182:95-796(-)